MSRKGFNAIERFIARFLSHLPFIKDLVKMSYFTLMSIITKQSHPVKCNYKLSCFGDTDSNTFFGYYDKSPVSKDGYTLCHFTTKKTYQKPGANDNLVIALFSPNDYFNPILKLHTFAYNWQQGSRLHWLDNDLFIFNDFDKSERKYFARVYSKNTLQEVKRFALPVQDSFFTHYFLSINYRRLLSLRPDYGYRNLPPLSKEDIEDYEQDGIWKVDYQTGQIKLLYSLSQIRAVQPKEEFARATHKINHVMISPSGKQFIFLHRYYLGKRRIDRLMLASSRGDSLKLLSNYGMVSHCFWVDENTILGYLRGPKNRDGYYIINIVSNSFEHVAKGVFDAYGDGHPHVFSDWFVTDTYPDKSRMQYLLLCNWKTGEFKLLGEFFHDIPYDGETRCDLHPRFSLDGKSIYFDSVFEGNRKLYRMDVEF